MELAEELWLRNITDTRQLRQQLQKTTIEIVFLKWTHHQPWFTSIDGSDWWIKFGNRFAPIQFMQQTSIVQCMYSLGGKKYEEKSSIIAAHSIFFNFNFFLFINKAIETPQSSDTDWITYVATLNKFAISQFVLNCATFGTFAKRPIW